MFFYKAILCVVSKARGIRAPINSAVAGGIAGYIMFSEETNVNVQIVLYLFSRVLTSGIYLLYKNGIIPKLGILEKASFTVLTCFSWGMVMYLFEKRKETLQTSLIHSMTLLYKDSEKWKDWFDAIPYSDFFRKLLG